MLAPVLLFAPAVDRAVMHPAVVQPAVSTFDTRRDPEFGDLTTSLRRLIAETHPRPRGAQHFCAVGYHFPVSQTNEHAFGNAWVHWREGNRLILWEGRVDSPRGDEALIWSRRNLDLVRDVVRTEDDIHFSTYLVTRAWVRGTIADCAARGIRYTIVPHARHARPSAAL